MDKIFLIRDQKVMIDSDLADLYGVSTKVLKQQVRRNVDRFPNDFMFELNENEFSILRSQNVTSSWGGVRYLPMVFTEQGVAMLSSVLNSKKAIQVNIQIMRIFTKTRDYSNPKTNWIQDKRFKFQVSFFYSLPVKESSPFMTVKG